MQQPGRAARSRTATVILGASALTLIVLILAYPDEAFQASLGGLRLWWTVLVPGLLPYLVVIELFAGFGLTRAFGALIDPAVRRLFRIPRGSGTAVVAGFLGGFPQGVQAARKVIDARKPSRKEALRLLSLTQLCSPALLITVVGAGFLQSVKAGILLALIHYLAAIAAGWLNRLLASSAPLSTLSDPGEPRFDEPAEDFYTALRTAKREDGRSFGQLMGDAVNQTIQALFTLCGFIILFSVLTRMISLQLPEEAMGRWFLLIPALLEPHIGAYAAAVRLEPSILQLACIGAALAWGGVSQHVQLNAVSGASPSGSVSFAARRSLHALLAFCLTFALAVPLAGWIGGPQGAMAVLPSFAADGAGRPMPSGGWAHIPDSLRYSLAWAGLMLGFAALFFGFRSLADSAKRK